MVTIARRVLVAVGALVLGGHGCATASAPGQGGAGFFPPGRTSLSPEAVAQVCWPQEAAPGERVLLTWTEGTVIFEAKEGASNVTARCLREVLTAAPQARPAGDGLEVGPPAQPIDGWSALAWVALLAPSRFGPERGLLEPAPLAAACLQLGVGGRPIRWTVRQAGALEILATPEVVTDAERCLEAVLGSTAWPAPRTLTLRFPAPTGATLAASEVDVYRAATASVGTALDPERVHEAIHQASSAVAACWDTALRRRPDLHGERTFRFQVDGSGAVRSAWVAGVSERGPVASDFLLDRCVARVLKGLSFRGGPGDGVYTWRFALRE